MFTLLSTPALFFSFSADLFFSRRCRSGRLRCFPVFWVFLLVVREDEASLLRASSGRLWYLANFSRFLRRRPFFCYD